MDELATQAKAGDADAVAELLRRYRPLLMAMARAYPATGDPAVEGDDVLQDAALVFLQSIREYDPDRGPWGPFVKRRVRWGVARRRQSTPRIRWTRLSEQLTVHLERTGVLADVDEYALDDRPALVAAIAALTRQQRHVLALVDVQGRDAGDVAHELGVTVRAVDRVRQRAKLRLREALDGSHPPGPAPGR